MKKCIPLRLFTVFAVTLLLFQTNNVFATICTFSGNTTYCSDPSTGKTTTYNQYGNNIYGSDGSSATIYYDPVYGSGSGLPSVSTAGVDMDSPEMKEAQAKYDEACAETPSASGESIIGGTQATNCRNAVVEWLQALSNAPKIDSSDDSESEENDYSDYSDSSDESLDEWTKKLLSDFGITNDSSQSQISCVPNSHIEGAECACDSGYFNNFKRSCVPLSNQNCIGVYGEGVEVNYNINSCVCKAGYVANPSGGCMSADTSAGNNTMDASSVDLPKQTTENTSINFEVKSEDILSSNSTGSTNSEAKLRKCPSTQCSVIGTYPKGTAVEIKGKYKNDTWLKVSVVNLGTGWIHQSLIDTANNGSESINTLPTPDTASSVAPIRMTRAEYEAKYVTQTQNPDNIEVKEEKVSWWRKVFSWFGF